MSVNQICAKTMALVSVIWVTSCASVEMDGKVEPVIRELAIATAALVEMEALASIWVTDFFVSALSCGKE